MTVEAVAGATKAASEGINILRAVRAEMRRKVDKRILKDLRTIYFVPEGLIDVIDQARRGELSPLRAKSVLDSMDIDDALVYAASDRLKFGEIEQLNIPTDDKLVLNNIARNKIAIRRYLKRTLCMIVDGKSISSEVAEKLYVAISGLNLEIGPIDRKLSERI